MRSSFFLSSIMATIGIVACFSAPYAQTFTNPIASSGADPWVVNHDGYYVRCYASGSNSITIALAQKLHEIETVFARERVWYAPAGTMYSREIWAPEIHFLNNRWYIYFAADDSLNSNHRMYVLESEGSDPMGPYAFKGKITPLVDRWAIDGTVLTKDDVSYFIWSGWEGFSGPQNLYISKMLNPWTIDTGKVVTRIEAENAKLTNVNVRATTSASGGKCAAGIDYADSKADFTMSVASAGTYLLKVVYANGTSDWSTHTVTVNGVRQGAIRYPVTGWEKWHTSTVLVNLKAGSNVIALGKGDRNAEIDYVALHSNTVDRVCISRPELAWEKLTSAINEGPQILIRGTTAHIVYSASASWTDNYCLGVLTLTGTNPLDSASWTKHPQTVFTKTDQVFGPGHCSFVKSPDGKEDWIVYHAAKTQGSGWSRKILTQPFTWDSKNFPVFGKPIPDGVPIDVPSGTNPYYSVPGRVQANHYYLMSGIQLQRTQDVSGLINVGWTDAGDWLEYRLDVKTPGMYKVEYRVASDVSGGIIELRSGEALLNTMGIPNTGGTQAWTTVQNEIRLSEGQQTVRVNVLKGGFNINWIDYQPGSPSSVAPHAIDLNRGVGLHYFEAFDLSGRLVRSGTVPAIEAHGTGKMKENMNTLSRGMYLVRVYEKVDKKMQPILVKNMVLR